MACIPIFQRHFLVCSLIPAIAASALCTFFPEVLLLMLAAPAAFALHTVLPTTATLAFIVLLSVSPLGTVLPTAATSALPAPAASAPVLCTLLPATAPVAFIALLAVLSVAAAGYLAFRYFSLKRALREADRELREICQDLSQNRILRLPLPDRDLEKLTESVNAALEDIRQERLSYEKREARFQELIENISHDLRTPLTVILGYLKWMKHDPQPHSLEIIQRNARTMEKLVSQFYAFSRLHAQDYALELQQVDVCRILRESLAGHYQILEEAHLALSCRLPEHPVLIRGNTEALERIFSNLLQNAGRYALSRLEIYLEETKDHRVIIAFQNDTERFTESDISRLFDRFYKCDVSRQQGGSGLGLTVARSLAELMDGSLTAELVPTADEGHEGCETLLRFSLSLPENAL